MSHRLSAWHRSRGLCLVLACCVGLGFVSSCQGAVLPLQFNGSVDADADEGNLDVLSDPSGQVSFEEIRDRFDAANRPKSAVCPGSCWVKVVVQSTAPDDLLAVIALFDFSVTDLWILDADQSVRHIGQAGGGIRADETKERSRRVCIIKGNAKTTLFLRLVADPFFNPLPVPYVRVAPLLADIDKVRAGTLFQGILVGSLLGLALYNLVLAVSTRDRSYRWYCLYLLMMALSFINTSGSFIESELVSSEYPIPARLTGHAADMLMWIGLILFTRTFLDTPTRLRRWDKVFLVPATLLIAGFVLGLLNSPYWIFVAYAGFVSAAPVGLVASMLALKQGFRPARFVAVGQAVLFLGALLQTVHDFGWIDAGIDEHRAALWLLTNETLWVFSSIEALIFSLALANRMKSLRDEVSAQTIRSLREREMLVNEQRVQLELEVAARTSDLVIEKDRSDQLLHNILPDEIAAELKQSGSTQPKRYENASVLFTDFSGFTTLVSSLPANRIVEELNEIFRSFDDILDQVGVEKIKTIGDAYMIAAGLPVECLDHAERCTEAALRMLEFIRTRNAVASIKWEMRAGIHSGSVIAGIVGKRKFAYDIFGDTVNIASRMESSGAVNRLNVSAYTYDLIRHRFAGIYRGKVNAKGKGEIDMYFIERLAEPESKA